MYETFEQVILYLGCYVLALWAYRFFVIFWRYFFGVHATTERYGEDSWAVITGSTDGIGKASAIHLARLGFNIVLISRSIDKLQTVAKEIQQIKGPSGKNVKTKIICNDFTKNFDAKTFEDIYSQHLAELDISILHNNVGMATVGPFLKMSEQDVHNMITCNTYGPVLLTRQVIAGMAKRNKEKKKRSLIVFTSALASIVPIPGGAVYSATKILNDFLCWGLEYELADQKIDVMAWRAAGVSTNMIGNEKPSLMTVTPEHYVKCGFSKVTSGVHSAYFMHELVHVIVSNMKDVLPLSVPQYLFGKFFEYAE